MFNLHLLRSNADVEVRPLGSRGIVLGRDESADWALPDADAEVSRRHVELTPVGNHVLLRALGKNGVTLTPNDTALTAGQKVLIGDGEGFVFGNYSILVRRQEDLHRTEGGSAGPSELLDAFLEGAGIDPSILAVEEPSAIMRRAGAMYMEAVRSLCDLTGERNRLKQSLALDQTTVSAGENNPLRWASPHRVAIDLLRGGEVGFLSGPEAIKSAATELRRHLQALEGSCAAAVAAAVERLAPQHLSKQAGADLGLFGLVFRRWRIFEAAHAALTKEIANDYLPMRRAFAAGYEKTLKLYETHGNDDASVSFP